MRVVQKVHTLKCLCNNIIYAVDYSFEQRDPNTATLIKEMCNTKRELCQKINLIWSDSEYLGYLINFSVHPRNLASMTKLALHSNSSIS